MQSLASPELEHKNSTSPSLNGVAIDNHTDQKGDGDTGCVAPWRALFFFSTKSNIPVFVAGIFASVISGAVLPAQALVVGRIFDRLTIYAAGTLSTDDFLHQEKKYVYYLLMIAAVSWVSLFFELALWIAFGELQAKNARDRSFHGLLRKDIEWYDLRKPGISALLPRLQAQIRALQLATSQPLGVLVGTAATTVLSLMQAFILSWRLALVTLSTAPIVVLAVAWVGRGMQAAFNKQNEFLTEAQKFATNAVTSIETVKYFNAQEVEQGKYITSIKRAATWYYRAVNANAIQMGLITLLSVSMFVQGFYYGGILVANGETSTANVITTFVSAISAFQGINAVLPQLIVLERGRQAGSILRASVSEFQRDSTNVRHQGTLKPDSCHGSIQVKNLTFCYPARPEHPALSDVSMFILGGEMTFLIGKSGSGKSTLGQLLMQFYTASHGSISIDGVDLDLLDTKWVRQNITLVEQTGSLFNYSLARNIALGRPNALDVRNEDVVEAVQFALLQSFISDLPHGMDTLVGHEGSTLSGGQRQRVALARARLRDAPILILDESTSALDRRTRSLIMDAIRQWRRGKTTLVITHDISQICSDDYLFILEHGKLVQEGHLRHLERLSGTPFQAFVQQEKSHSRSLPTSRDMDLKAVPSSGRRSPRTEMPSRTLTSADSLGHRVAAGEQRQPTLAPSLFTQGSPLLGFTSPVAAGGARWTRFTYGSPSDPPSLPNWSESERSSIHSAATMSDLSERTSLSADSLILHTGRAAREARVDTRGIPGRRVKPAEMKLEHVNKTRKPNLPTREIITETSREKRYPVQTVRQILSTLWPNIDFTTKAAFLLGFWGATMHAISTPAFSYVLSKLLRLYSIPGGDKQQSLVYAMIILAIAVLDAVHTYASHFCLEYVGQRWIDRIRGKAVQRILDQPRAFFDEKDNAVSRLTGCLDRNAEEMRNLLGRFAALVWIAVLMCAVSIVWALITQWKMALIALATAPYILGVAKAFSMISEKWEKRTNDIAEEAVAIFTETFTNIKTVRALTLERHFTDKYVETTNRAMAIGFRRAFFAGFFFGLSDSAGHFSLALIFYFGAKLVADGVPVEHIVQVFVFLIFAITNLNMILGFIPQIATAKDMASRLLRLANLPQSSHEHQGHTHIQSMGDIVFDRLQFSYPSRPEAKVLQDVSMRIRPGTCTAIVGGSGSGKSTIANLLLNLYSTPNVPHDHHRAKDLTVGGRNIKRIVTPTLRTLIVPVSQTPTLFSATVAKNIAYGLSPYSPYNNLYAISTAAKQSGIHDFITSLPQGYDTLIGEGGLGLSGGQAQRIAIARALVRQPAVLILDEATSALDVVSTRLIRQTIADLVHGRDAAAGQAMTVIIITHSREMMEIADKVVVLENGSVAEEGEFEELMQRRGGALRNLLSGGEFSENEEYEH